MLNSERKSKMQIPFTVKINLSCPGLNQQNTEGGQETNQVIAIKMGRIVTIVNKTIYHINQDQQVEGISTEDTQTPRPLYRPKSAGGRQRQYAQQIGSNGMYTPKPL